MSDAEKLRIKQLDDRSDYGLWKIRVEAACSSKGVSDALQKSKERTNVSDDHKKTASGIIVAALSDPALRVVRSVIGNPVDMLEKLDARYDSRSTATKISKISELVSVRYTNVKHDITKHIDRMAALQEQLKSMEAIMDDAVQVGILIASIDVLELTPVTAAIKTLAEKDITWETVTERLIEEWRGLTNAHKEDSKLARNVCTYCNRPGHHAANCWTNPANPNNRLGRLKGNPPSGSEPKKENQDNKTETGQTSEDPDKKKKKRKKKKERAALAK